MPETFTIGGKQFPKTFVYSGAALTAGIVGYAWWKQGTTLEEEPEPLPTDLYSDERIPPTTLDTYDVKVDTRTGFKTDVEWFNAGVDQLNYNFGIQDIAVASNALDKYLNRKPLSKSEVPMVNYVINSIGPPPTGARPIVQEQTQPGGSTPITPKTPGNISGLKQDGMFPQTIKWSWNKATDTDHYDVQVFELGTHPPPAGFGEIRIRNAKVIDSEYLAGSLKPWHYYRIEVQAFNRDGAHSTKVSHTGRAGGDF
jgi:hypothetical protein